MTTATVSEHITLYFKEGSSDKVYQASIDPSGTGFIVNFAYGRRGGTMNTGTKTAKPVDNAAARKIYDKLLAEKMAKGYTPGEDGTPYQDTERQTRATGVTPQLLNAIEEAEAQRLVADKAWWAQEKFDGKRVLIRRSDQEITGINRSGLVIALPKSIVAAALTIGSQQWLMDGECIGDTYWAFDILESACTNLRAQAYAKRMTTLFGMLSDDDADAIRLVPTASNTSDKRAMLERLRRDNREGIVFKRHDAAYTPGRPASGGDQVKVKFTATASCIVAGVNGSKRSVALELLDGPKRIGVGNVTIPANQPIPGKGSIVELKYLYAFRGGALYQPVCLGVRDDITTDACVLRQLKFKPEDCDAEG